MRSPALLPFIVGFLSLSQAAEISRPALKDSTILRSTTGCPNCPDLDCYKCTLGHEDTIDASTGARSYVRSIIGFELPVPSGNVQKCMVQTPAFTELRPHPLDVTVAAAKASDWEEDTINGANAPESGVIFNTVNVPAYSNLQAFDVTPACQAASEDGQFSIYLAAVSGSFKIWSKDSGNPAILHVTYKEEK